MFIQTIGNMLDFLVLASVNCNDTYGYLITQQIKKVISISDSTLYPVMRRLQKLGYLNTYDVPYMGRNRRYYSLTESGKKELQENIAEWEEYKKQVDSIIYGGISNGE